MYGSQYGAYGYGVPGVQPGYVPMANPGMYGVPPMPPMAPIGYPPNMMGGIPGSGMGAMATAGMTPPQRRAFYASLLTNPMSAQAYIDSVFYSIDTNRSGSITYIEFQNAFLTNPELNHLLACGYDYNGIMGNFMGSDMNCDGRISRLEFYNMMYAKLTQAVNGGCRAY